MAIPERKIVPIRNDPGDSFPESERLVNRSIDCLTGQLNSQLGKSSTGKVNSHDSAASKEGEDSPSMQRLRSRNHKIVLSYLSAKQIWLTTNNEISMGSGIPLETVRYALRKLEALGCITKTTHSNCGLRIDVLKTAGDLGIETKHPNSTASTNKIDRIYNKSIYLTQEDIDRLWPNVSKRGFRSVHYRELIRDFETKDIDVSNIKLGLTYLEHQLTRNALADRNGIPIRDPVAYLIKALRNNGYYSRPRDYISPEEQVEIDRLEEQKRIQKMRNHTRKLKAINWWERTPLDHPAKLDRQLGSMESWIIHQYDKYGPEDETDQEGHESLPE